MEAKDKPRIADVVEHYFEVVLPTGAHGRAKVNCISPHHEDRNASASVDHNQQAFHCFACGMSADSIALIMEQEGVEFKDAIRISDENGWGGPPSAESFLDSSTRLGSRSRSRKRRRVAGITRKRRA